MSQSYAAIQDASKTTSFKVDLSGIACQSPFGRAIIKQYRSASQVFDASCTPTSICFPTTARFYLGVTHTEFEWKFLSALGCWRNLLINTAIVLLSPPLLMKRLMTSTAFSQCGQYVMISAAVRLPLGKGRLQLGLPEPKASVTRRYFRFAAMLYATPQ
jgi:hypothetical protein